MGNGKYCYVNAMTDCEIGIEVIVHCLYTVEEEKRDFKDGMNYFYE